MNFTLSLDTFIFSNQRFNLRLHYFSLTNIKLFIDNGKLFFYYTLAI